MIGDFIGLLYSEVTFPKFHRIDSVGTLTKLSLYIFHNRSKFVTQNKFSETLRLWFHFLVLFQENACHSPTKSAFTKYLVKICLVSTILLNTDKALEQPTFLLKIRRWAEQTLLTLSLWLLCLTRSSPGWPFLHAPDLFAASRISLSKYLSPHQWLWYWMPVTLLFSSIHLAFSICSFLISSSISYFPEIY